MEQARRLGGDAGPYYATASACSACSRSPGTATASGCCSRSGVNSGGGHSAALRSASTSAIPAEKCLIPTSAAKDQVVPGAPTAAPAWWVAGRCQEYVAQNYLWFAERTGAPVLAEREVVDIRPLGFRRTQRRYAVTTQHPGAWFERHGGLSRRVAWMMSAERWARTLLALVADSPARCAHQRSARTAGAHQTANRSWPSRCPEGAARPWNDVGIKGGQHSTPAPDTHIGNS